MLVAVYAAIRRSYADGRLVEELRLWPDLITVERREPRGAVPALARQPALGPAAPARECANREVPHAGGQRPRDRAGRVPLARRAPAAPCRAPLGARRAWRATPGCADGLRKPPNGPLGTSRSGSDGAACRSASVGRQPPAPSLSPTSPRPRAAWLRSRQVSPRFARASCAGWGIVRDGEATESPTWSAEAHPGRARHDTTPGQCDAR
jgi:hypothetical protein